MDNYYGTNNTIDENEFDQEDIREYRLLSVVAYIWFGFIFTNSIGGCSKYAKFHANQGCILFICDILIGVVAGVVFALLMNIPVLGSVAMPISIAFSVVYTILSIGIRIYCIVNVMKDKAKQIPVIGKLTIIAWN